VFQYGRDDEFSPLVREITLKNGLVGVKVRAMDETWPRLKLIVP